MEHDKMHEAVAAANRSKAVGLLKMFERRHMEGFFCEDKKEAAALIMNMVPEGARVSWGDSMTIDAMDIKSKFRDGPYIVYDRDAAGEDIEKRMAIMRQAIDCDYYFMSANAITQSGELVNIDGRGNRAAAISFGPRFVVVVAGMNKLTQDVDAAKKRIKTVAAPANSIRHGFKTPCSATGSCTECFSDDCMCCQEIVTRFSRVPRRIKVILVNESLGF